jgi:hypothetical protein
MWICRYSDCGQRNPIENTVCWSCGRSPLGENGEFTENLKPKPRGVQFLDIACFVLLAIYAFLVFLQAASTGRVASLRFGWIRWSQQPLVLTSYMLISLGFASIMVYAITCQIRSYIKERRDKCEVGSRWSFGIPHLAIVLFFFFFVVRPWFLGQ